MSASTTPKINLKRLAHIYYVHADLERANQFLCDFGFTIVQQTKDAIYYRGYGTEPFVYCAIRGSENAFGGGAFAVESLADLELAAATLPSATPIHDLDAPGGGKRVTFYDPIDNFPTHLVYGQTPVERSTPHPVLAYNHPTTKNRQPGQFQRFEKGPAPVHKLGHFVLCVTNFAATFDFFTTRFNLKPSDVLHDDKGRDVGSFLHLDRVGEKVDHHCVLFFEGPKYHVHHSSYEVHDFDIQSLGHDWLLEKGYNQLWGVGRHILGSQIFDYWWDPSHFMMEHYADGDMVDDKTPINRGPLGNDMLHIWGPDTPPEWLA
ncbi:hypothetical protein CDV55_105243 [Aspergillus turcosus]|nr:hypothetical protein CDV55_105243 [Aspergillus turcosus]